MEFRLGLRGDPNLPDRTSLAWCDAIEEQAGGRPSFPCDGDSNPVEKAICGSVELAGLDRKLAAVFAAASASPDSGNLQAEQRGWIKGRDTCRISERVSICVRDSYLRRIAELQARYRLVAYRGPVAFKCSDRQEITATLFETRPPTMIAEHADQVSLMYLQPAASGSRYVGRNEVFWEHGSEATMRWGYDAEEMRCLPRSDGS